jgi:NO-binding membrane sensor protein with MHYT domain
MGGTVAGLAIAVVATAAMAAIKTSPRILVELELIILHPLVEKQLRIQRVTQKGQARYHKSNIAGIFFCGR